MSDLYSTSIIRNIYKKPSEKSEVTITHQTTDEIKEKLRAKLAKLVNPEPEVQDAVFIDGEEINVEKELGLATTESDDSDNTN